MKPKLHKIRFCFSDGWKAPIIPILNVDDEFIKERNNELNYCFSELENKLLTIDTSTNKGFEDLLTAVHVIKQLRTYKFTINKSKGNNADFVPYTASNKGRVG